ncbi:hypothetical protein [Rhizobium sp. SL42]|uniref:hypothetical protein n=1 Tax=Rhizobium sp. SL42 TaxID=2806346 RepID=UPI001F220058|nr:hypothetical protein [Rhizobium sp. SL42]UJW74118.1 hypothetical protein IM739_14685 [Rhizobium sp. SL42]
MNSAFRIALAGAMTVASLSGVAVAQTATQPMVDTTTTTNSTTMDANVSVVMLGSLNTESDRAKFAEIEALSKNDTARAEARSMIEADANLAAALTAKNVQLENVVHIETAANGGKVVYVQ